VHWIDWTLLFAPLALILLISLCTRRPQQERGRLPGGRTARRAVSALHRPERGVDRCLQRHVAVRGCIRERAFSLGWWDALSGPGYLLVSIFGFVHLPVSPRPAP